MGKTVPLPRGDSPDARRIRAGLIRQAARVDYVMAVGCGLLVITAAVIGSAAVLTLITARLMGALS